MTLSEWVQQNRGRVDWAEWDRRWSRMQAGHNPSRDEQIRAIYLLSGAADMAEPRVLDLGCGPGALARYFKAQQPNAKVMAVDVDPFLLEMFRQCAPEDGTVIVEEDLRQSEWIECCAGTFDAAVSLTTLHWLSKDSQRRLCRRVRQALKPGGIFLAGDLYAIPDETMKPRLLTCERAAASGRPAESWEEYWAGLFARYDLEEPVKQFENASGVWEGREDGYALDFHLAALREAKFQAPAVYWLVGRRAVFGGRRPASE